MAEFGSEQMKELRTVTTPRSSGTEGKATKKRVYEPPRVSVTPLTSVIATASGPNMETRGGLSMA